MARSRLPSRSLRAAPARKRTACWEKLTTATRSRPCADASAGALARRSQPQGKGRRGCGQPPWSKFVGDFGLRHKSPAGRACPTSGKPARWTGVGRRPGGPFLRLPTGPARLGVTVFPRPSRRRRHAALRHSGVRCRAKCWTAKSGRFSTWVWKLKCNTAVGREIRRPTCAATTRRSVVGSRARRAPPCASPARTPPTFTPEPGS